MKKIIFSLIVTIISNFAIGQTTELLISEYIEGSGYNKALEIFNGTGHTIDLSDYSLKKDINGNNDFSVAFQLQGLLANGDVFIVAHPYSSDLIKYRADVLNWGICNFNGDDQVMLDKHGTEIDRIGISGDINFALDKTFIRTPEIWAPVSGEQDPNTNGQWIQKANDFILDLGIHHYKGDYTNASLLFISEYIEGSYDNKALEIFNGTGAAVDLSDYSLKKDINGNNIFSESLVLSGILADGEVYVVAHTESNSELKNHANILDYQICNFNGDDQIMLCKNNMEIDRIGISGDVNFGERKTFIRTPEIADPVSEEQDPNTNGQWIIKPVDYFSNLGIHKFNPNNQALLLISEYIEGSAYNKALEIYNSTENTIYLSTYSLKKDLKGNNDFSVVLPLSGTLESGEVYVIVHPESTQEILAKADILNQQICEFNGSDQVILCKNNIEIDHFGIVGDILFAADVTFIRNPDITTPVTGNQDPRSNGEWILKPKDYFGNLHVTEGNFSSDKNYIKTTQYTEPDNLTKIVSVSYFNGFGKTEQSIVLNASISGKDIIQPYDYDEFGRMKKSYLSYTDDSNGEYTEDAIIDQSSFYNNLGIDGFEIPYSEVEYDNSPYNRIIKQSVLGDDINSINVGYEYTPAGDIVMWEVDDNNQLIKSVKNYPANSLLKYTIKDADNKETNIFKDKAGRVLLKEEAIAGVKTGYVYDKYGQLRYVLSPEGVDQMKGSLYNMNSDLVKKYCYYYEYDEKHQLISKQLPGKEPIYFRYDKLYRLRLTQDGNQRIDNKWIYINYDNLGRTISTGLAYIDEKLPIPDYLAPTDVNGRSTFLTFQYYDNYDFIEDINLNFDTDLAYHDKFERTNGQATGSKVRVMNEGEEWLTSAVYYDKYGQVIQSITQNYVGGYDIVCNKYNFAGNLIEGKHKHTTDTDTKYLIYLYDYDSMGRLLKVQLSQNADASNAVIINEQIYDEIGQVVEKKIHSENGTEYLQDVKYGYNIKGAITNINNPQNLGTDLFGMNIFYNEDVSGFNNTPYKDGKISVLQWNSQNLDQVQTYMYEYDDLNRLTNAVFAPDHKYDVLIDYDLNGNITQLNRSGEVLNQSVDPVTGLPVVSQSFEAIDELSYSYNGNQLIRVQDAIGEISSQLNNDFRNVTTKYDEYSYDANGNMVSDINKGINLITYNHLNQPVVVQKAAGDRTEYLYTATGEKLESQIFETGLLKSTTEYSGAFVYENNTLSFINIPGGRIVETAGGLSYYEYNLTDHLGNIRVTFTKNETTGNAEIIQEDHYYPFGMRMSGQHFSNTDLINKFLYNGKEQQEQTLYYDYGFRQLDPALGRWHVIDAMAEKYYSTSPYNYVRNNPISRIDIFGLWDDPSDYDNDGGDGNYNGGDSSGGLVFSWNDMFDFGENMSNWFRWTMTGTGVHPLFLEYGGIGGSYEMDFGDIEDRERVWDNETDINFRKIPDDVRDVLLNDIRLAMKAEFRHNAWINAHIGEHYNDGITEHGDYIEDEGFSPINFNTRIKFKSGTLSLNEYAGRITLDATDYHYQIPAIMIYTPHDGLNDNNFVNDVSWVNYPYGVNRQGGASINGYQINFINVNNMIVVKLILTQEDFTFLTHYMTGGNIKPIHKKR